MSKTIWLSSGYTVQIKRIKKVPSHTRFWAKDTYHDTWQEAHAALIARLAKEEAEALKQLRKVHAAQKRANAMKNPSEGEE